MSDIYRLDSAEMWAAWLLDRGQYFDPQVQGPRFKECGDRMISLEADLAAAKEDAKKWDAENEKCHALMVGYLKTITDLEARLAMKCHDITDLGERLARKSGDDALKAHMVAAQTEELMDQKAGIEGLNQLTAAQSRRIERLTEALEKIAAWQHPTALIARAALSKEDHP